MSTAEQLENHIINVLIQQQIISPDAKEEIAEKMDIGLTLGEVLIGDNYVSDTDLSLLLADIYRKGKITLEEIEEKFFIAKQTFLENFAKKYNAYYFIANSDKNPNEEIINQILSDLNYQRSLTVPFKVMYNQNGELEKLSNFNNPAGEYYYNGAISTSVLKDDFERINNARSKN